MKVCYQFEAQTRTKYRVPYRVRGTTLNPNISVRLILIFNENCHYVLGQSGTSQDMICITSDVYPIILLIVCVENTSWETYIELQLVVVTRVPMEDLTVGISHRGTCPSPRHIRY